MWTPENLAGLLILTCLTIYMISGGADFGGGIWDLFATGSRAKEQRRTIEESIGPIWEANHVWLIAVVVLLFVCFPKAFAAISIALHVPLTLMLVGVVLRGTAFVFRDYDRPEEATQNRWGRLFAIASLISPLMLGICVGAIASGEIRFASDFTMTSSFFDPWLAPFPILVGMLCVSLCAFLAAIYLTNEAQWPELKSDFRTRAWLAAVAVGIAAFGAMIYAPIGAPRIAEGLLFKPWSLPLQLLTAIAALTTFGGLCLKWDRLARASGIIQVVFIMCGWGMAQHPFLVVPDFTLLQAAAPAHVIDVVLTIFVCGSFLLIPAFLYLLHVFKVRKSAT